MLSTYAKLYGLLDRGERRQVAGLMAIILVLALVELAGVASILPFLAVLADPEVIERNRHLRAVYQATGFEDPQDFLILLAAVSVGLVLVVQLLRALTTYLISRFSRMRELSLGLRLLGNYLHQPYIWFLERHSADLGARVLSEVGKAVGGVLIPALRLIVQLAATGVVVILLFVVDPVVTASTVLAVGASYGLIALISRRFLDRIGTERYASNQSAYRALQEAFGGVKDVKLLGIEHAYLERYRVPAERTARNTAAFTVATEMPRYLLEAIIFGGMVALLLVLMLRGDGSFATVLPTVGLYAFASARLFPSIQQIYAQTSALRFNGPGLDGLIADLAEPVPPPARTGVPVAFTDRIELSDVSFSYPTGVSTSLDGFSMEVRANTTVGIVGRSGAGKTTAVDVLLGLLAPQAGTLRVDGVPIPPDRVGDWQDLLGYVPQEIFITDDTLAANIALGIPRERIDMSAVERAARAAELHDFVKAELAHGYQTALGERGVRLSGGQRQRVGIARALYRNPPILVLDEATSALDTETERAVMGAIRNLAQSKTIVIIAHRLTTVEFCDRIYVMEAGRVVRHGPAAEILADLRGQDIE